MKKRLLRIVSAALAAIFFIGICPLYTSGEGTEGTGLKIAVFDGLTDYYSAPYDAAALAELFNGAGHEAVVIDPETLATRELFSAQKYDLLMIPSGAAFPYTATDNFKKFLREGGKLITSGGFAFSNPVYPEATGGEVGLAGMIHSDSTAYSPSLFVVLAANKFKRGVKYTITLDCKTENIRTDKGLAHNSIYIYGSGGSLITWKDFTAVTGGSSDWDRKSYTFTVPSDAERVDIRLGLYITSGTIYFDNVRLTGDDGSTVFFDGMEDGIGGWQRTQSGSSVSYGTAEGVFSSSDRVLELYAANAGDGGCRYDITDAIKGKTNATLRFSCNYTVSGGNIGARVVYEKGGAKQSETVLCSETGSAAWHGHCVEFTPETSYDKAYLEFFFENSYGKFIIDEISVACGGETVFAEHNGEKTRTMFGAVNENTPSRENEKQFLASNEPESVGDLLFYTSSNVPLFDSETTFSGAVRLGAAEAQSVFTGDVLTDANGISGYSAITWVGNNRGRYQPLLYAYDSLGRKIGVAAAMFRVFYSPSDYGNNGGIKYWNDYVGTDIGFFGVTDRDLFAPGNDALREGLVRLAELLCGKPYITNVSNSYNCYRKDEKPILTCNVENGGAKGAEVEASISVYAEDTGEEVFASTETFKIPAHMRRQTRFRLNTFELEDDFYYYTVTLKFNGEEIDRYQSGFVVWDDEVVANGPKYTYHDNYIYIVQPDGTEKAAFIPGVDDGGNTFVDEDQTPLVWKQDFERRQDAGILLYENLQQYRGYGDFSAVFEDGYPTEKHMRTVDCAVYLAQKYGQIYMMGMLLGSNSAVSDAQLEIDKEYVAKMAERYKDVPGMIYYLNGDLIVKPDASTDGLYREFLLERYGSEEKLYEVRKDIKDISKARYDQNHTFGGNGWSDVKAYDQNLFRTQLIKRWVNALTATVQSVVGKDKAVVCEFFAWPSESIDVEHSIGDLTYSNIGFFDKLEMLTETLANSDQRYRGKSFGIGESNKRTHPDFGETAEYYASGSVRYAEAYVRAVFYNTLGMGGNHYQVWCFKDETKYSFPWGLTYMNSVGERNTFNIYRNMNLLASEIEPEYVSPEVAFITPDSLRMSGSRGWYVGHYATLRGIDMAQSTLVDNILTLNENELVIPESVKVIFYPLAFTVPDNVYEALTEFVKNGGTLYISGDPAYDVITRQRSYGERAETLTGVECTEVIYGGVDDEGADVTYTTDAGKRAGKPCVKIALKGAEGVYYDEAGEPVYTVYSLGKGKVYYSTVPVEIASYSATYEADVALYQKVIESAGIACDAVKGSAMGLRTSLLHLKDGGKLRVITNSSNIDIKTEYTSGENVYSFRLGGWQTAVFVENAQGELTALDVPTAVQKNGEKFLNNDCTAALVPLDGNTLQSTHSLAVLPESTGGFYLYCDKWNSPVAVRGTVYYGEFLRAEDASVSYKGGRLAIDSAKEGEIIIICEKGEEEAAIAALLGQLGISAEKAQQNETSEPEETVSGAEENVSGLENVSEAEDDPGSGALIWIIAGAVFAVAAAAAAVIMFKKKKA